MAKEELLLQLKSAKCFEEVEKIAAENPELDAEKVWQEIQNHQSGNSAKLDLDELDNVSGGADRDWQKKVAPQPANPTVGAAPMTSASCGL